MLPLNDIEWQRILARLDETLLNAAPRASMVSADIAATGMNARMCLNLFRR